MVKPLDLNLVESSDERQVEQQEHSTTVVKMSSPAVKDLPKIENTLKGEIEKDHNLKPTEVKE